MIKVVSGGQTVGFSLRFKFNLFSPRTIRIILSFFERDEFVEQDCDSRRSTGPYKQTPLSALI